MLCNFNMKLMGTITLDNFAMGERYTLCTSHYLSPGGGGPPGDFGWSVMVFMGNGVGISRRERSVKFLI